MAESQAAGYGDRRAGLSDDPRRRSRAGDLRVLMAVVSVAALLLLLTIFGPPRLDSFFQPGTPSSLVPIGTVLEFGSVALGVCPSNSTFASDGCDSGHYVCSVTIAQAAITLGDFGLVVSNQSGGVWHGDSNAGFTILDANDSVLAQFPTLDGPMYAGSTWIYANMTSRSTQLSTYDSLQLDMGLVSPEGMGWFLSGFPIDGSGYTGTTTPTLLG